MMKDVPGFAQGPQPHMTVIDGRPLCDVNMSKADRQPPAIAAPRVVYGDGQFWVGRRIQTETLPAAGGGGQCRCGGTGVASQPHRVGPRRVVGPHGARGSKLRAASRW
jgi:hypothetical protein